MGKYFTVGEFAKLHKFSRQTLIYYDKIGLLKPDYINPENGYRYYGPEQLELLDLLYTLKEAGLSLEEIKNFMENRSVSQAVDLFSEKVCELERKIHRQEIIKGRLEAKVAELEKAKKVENLDFKKEGNRVFYEKVKERYIFKEAVKEPYSSVEIDVAIKNLFENARCKNVEHNFQLITSVPLEKIKKKKYTEANECYTVIDKEEFARIKKEFSKDKKLVGKIPKGEYAVFYHRGPYRDTGETYEKALDIIDSDGYQVEGLAYEESVIDCLTSKDENNYLTKITIKLKDEQR